MKICTNCGHDIFYWVDSVPPLEIEEIEDFWCTKCDTWHGIEVNNG